MPLLADLTVSQRPVAWTFIHIWRVADGMIVEHWACRDDMGLLSSCASDQSASGPLRPVRGGEAVGVTGWPLDQLDPVAVRIVDQRRPEVR